MVAKTLKALGARKFENLSSNLFIVQTVTCIEFKEGLSNSRVKLP